MSNGMLVLFCVREIPYSSGSSWRTYLLVSVLYTDDPDPDLWIIRYFTDGWRRKENNKWITGILLFFSVVLIVCVLTNDLHQQFSGLKDRFLILIKITVMVFFYVDPVLIIACLVIMEILLVKKSRIPDRKTVLATGHSGLLCLAGTSPISSVALIKTLQEI